MDWCEEESLFWSETVNPDSQLLNTLFPAKRDLLPEGR